MTSGKVLGSVGCKFSGLLGRKIFFTRGVSSFGGEVAACGAGRLDASQMQPAFAEGPPPKSIRIKGK